MGVAVEGDSPTGDGFALKHWLAWRARMSQHFWLAWSFMGVAWEAARVVATEVVRELARATSLEGSSALARYARKGIATDMAHAPHLGVFNVTVRVGSPGEGKTYGSRGRFGCSHGQRLACNLRGAPMTGGSRRALGGRFRTGSRSGNWFSSGCRRTLHPWVCLSRTVRSCSTGALLMLWLAHQSWASFLLWLAYGRRVSPF